MVLSLFSAIELGAMHANASSADSDGDGMPLGLEYILGLSDSDWDFDGDELPDGYEWTFGMDPSNQDNPQTDDSDGDGVSNWLEYQYGMPANWDNPATPNILDQGVFYSGMIPVSNWNEEGYLLLQQMMLTTVPTLVHSNAMRIHLETSALMA